MDKKENIDYTVSTQLVIQHQSRRNSGHNEEYFKNNKVPIFFEFQVVVSTLV